MKTTSGWDSYNNNVNNNGNNSTGFSAIGAGYLSGNYLGNDNGFNARIWSSTPDDAEYAWFLFIFCETDYATMSNRSSSKNKGLSVRCVKD